MKIRESFAIAILRTLLEIQSGPAKVFFPEKYGKKYGYSRYKQELWRLQRRGLIRKKEEIYYLTSKGEKEAFLNNLFNNKLKTNKESKWDGKWRIIFFDIPEKKRTYRDKLRHIIKAIGFKEFQKSVWIYPYKVPTYLKEILFDEKIKHHTRLITTSDIEYDKDLRIMFKL